MSNIHIQKDISLKKFSTFSVGGNADFFVEISSKEELQEAREFAKNNNLLVFILGGGSNLLFSDKGFRGLVIHMKNQKILSLGDGKFSAESGALMGQVFGFCKKENRNFALLSTIPGTIGGATAGNAGLPSGEIKDIFLSATVYDTKTQKFLTVEKDFFNFQYRKTNFHTPEISERYIIWEVTFQLPFLEESKIEEILKENFLIRKSKQPFGKTGGSFFFNPGKGKEGAAGYLIEQVGMKGAHEGDAFFSEKHANFLMNKKNATQKEIKTLAKKAQIKVLEIFEIQMNPEVKILDEFGKREKLYAVPEPVEG